MLIGVTVKSWYIIINLKKIKGAFEKVHMWFAAADCIKDGTGNYTIG
jgi:hypothetical protein